MTDGTISRHDDIVTGVINALKSAQSRILHKLAKFIQRMNDENPYDHDNDYLMWQEQCSINFPLLYLGSIYLYKYAKRKHCNNFLFATRDCCYWYRLFKLLFPNANSHYFDSSRNMFEKATTQGNHAFNVYVQSLVADGSSIKEAINKSIYVDIHGTGQNALNYFEQGFGTVPHCFLLTAVYKNYQGFPAICRKYFKEGKFVNLVFKSHGSPIEMLNYDRIGTLQDYSPQQGPIRDPPEYDVQILNAYHACMNYVLAEIKSDQLDHHHDLIKCHSIEIRRIIRAIGLVIRDDKPVISKYINHMRKHEIADEKNKS